MPTFSSASGAVWTLNPAPSASLAVWWAALHGLLACAALAAAVPVAVKPVLWLAIALHWRRRRPCPGGPIVCAEGVWSLPAAGAFGLALGDGTAFSTWWVRLELVDGRTSHDVLVLRDQLAPEAWRRLQLAVREPARVPRSAAR